jgi:hypothetical protein
MLGPIIFCGLILLVVALVRLRRWWQRRGDPPMFVPTWPEIEYRQPYGGWNAEAYDAGTGRDRPLTLGRISPPTPGTAPSFRDRRRP